MAYTVWNDAEGKWLSASINKYGDLALRTAKGALFKCVHLIIQLFGKVFVTPYNKVQLVVNIS